VLDPTEAVIAAAQLGAQSGDPPRTSPAAPPPRHHGGPASAGNPLDAWAVKFIRKLRAVGCRFALDDFGTGANSLKNLNDLPVGRVKIDGSLVSDILTNEP
jgi:hypothetical protein